MGTPQYEVCTVTLPESPVEAGAEGGDSAIMWAARGGTCTTTSPEPSGMVVRPGGGAGGSIGVGVGYVASKTVMTTVSVREWVPSDTVRARV